MHEDYDVHISARAVMHAPLGNWPMTACLLYTRKDPIAVTIDVDPCDVAMQPIQWVLSRSMLDDAFSYPGQPQGQGDVRITYLFQYDWVRVELIASDHHGYVPITIEAEPVIVFMEQSLRLMPTKDENVGVDDAIAHLLDGTWER